MTDDLTAIGPDHFHGRDPARSLAQVQVGGAVYVDASFGKVYGTVGVMREARQELFADWNHFVLLLAAGGDSAGDQDVLCIPHHAAKRVTGKRSGRKVAPRHDHTRVQSARERD